MICSRERVSPQLFSKTTQWTPTSHGGVVSLQGSRVINLVKSISRVPAWGNVDKASDDGVECRQWRARREEGLTSRCKKRKAPTWCSPAVPTPERGCRHHRGTATGSKARQELSSGKNKDILIKTKRFSCRYRHFAKYYVFAHPPHFFSPPF
jgi:hypothetical protein